MCPPPIADEICEALFTGTPGTPDGLDLCARILAAGDGRARLTDAEERAGTQSLSSAWAMAAANSAVKAVTVSIAQRRRVGRVSDI